MLILLVSVDILNVPGLCVEFATVQPEMRFSPEGELFDWGECLNDAAVTSAQVSSFKHVRVFTSRQCICIEFQRRGHAQMCFNSFEQVPMADSWENINVGMKIEVLNTDNDLPYDVYWVATVIRLAGKLTRSFSFVFYLHFDRCRKLELSSSGYKAQVRYEGFTNEVTHDFWINLCIQDVHPVGWCATMGKSLVPPKSTFCSSAFRYGCFGPKGRRNFQPIFLCHCSYPAQICRLERLLGQTTHWCSNTASKLLQQSSGKYSRPSNHQISQGGGRGQNVCVCYESRHCSGNHWWKTSPHL